VGTGLGTAMFIEQRLVPNTELGHLELYGMAAEDYCSARARKRHGLSWRAWAGRFQDYLDLIERLFSPDLIVIGGGVSRPDRVEKYFDQLVTNAELVTATLQNEAGIIGAACAARRALPGA
jgi:polyphosphate glucokinase